MSLPESTQSLDIANPFNKKHLSQIAALVIKYDTLYNELGGLETKVQALLLEQERVVNQLNAIRQDEERFFEETSAELDIDIDYLKRMASIWAKEKNS
jgi:hypothetical protein